MVPGARGPFKNFKNFADPIRPSTLNPQTLNPWLAEAAPSSVGSLSNQSFPDQIMEVQYAEVLIVFCHDQLGDAILPHNVQGFDRHLIG